MKNQAKLLPQKKLIQMLIEWSSINTYSYNLEGLERQLDLLKKAFSPLGDHCSLENLPPHKTLTDFGEKIALPLGRALLVKTRPKAKKQIFISGHYDTVFPVTSLFQTPQLSNDILNGPGVMDMKGGLLILLSALNALEQTPDKEQLGWTLLIAPDEEIGSPGSKSLIEKYCKGSELGIALEPCLPNGNLINARKGSLNFLLSARGKAAHAGRDFHQGINAIYKLLPFMSWCLDNDIEETNINLGKILGGGPLNVIPNYAQIGAGVRSFRIEAFEELKSKIKSFDNLEYTEISYRPPKPFDEATKALFHLYEECSTSLGYPLKFSSSGGVCDGNNISSHGIPTIDTVGAKGGGIHSDQEYIEIESLESKAKVLFLFLTKLARMPIDEFPLKLKRS